jgi:hypothetical protein
MIDETVMGTPPLGSHYYRRSFTSENSAPRIDFHVTDLSEYIFSCPCELCKRIAKRARHALNYMGMGSTAPHRNPKKQKPCIKSDSEIPDSLEDLWGSIGKGEEEDEYLR